MQRIWSCRCHAHAESPPHHVAEFQHIKVRDGHENPDAPVSFWCRRTSGRSTDVARLFGGGVAITEWWTWARTTKRDHEGRRFESHDNSNATWIHSQKWSSL